MKTLTGESTEYKTPMEGSLVTGYFTPLARHFELNFAPR